MKLSSYGWLIISLAMVYAWPGPVSAASKFDPALREQLAGQARVTVMIRYQTQATTVGLELHERRRLMERDREAVQAQISGAGWRMRHGLATAPYMIGEIDAQGLDRLEACERVESIAQSLPLTAATNESRVATQVQRVYEQMGLTGQGVTVGLVDSGIDLDHPDLAGALLVGRHFLDQGGDVGSDVQDDNGHGTHLAGIITGDGTLAPRGLAPGAKLVVVRVLHMVDGGLTGDSVDLVSAIDWLVDHHDQFPGLKFVNIAIAVGDPAAHCPCSGLSNLQPLEDVINVAEQEGIIIISSTGNGGDWLGISPPSCYANVVSVAASYDASFAQAPLSPYTSFADFPGFANCADTSVVANTLACFSNRASCLDFVAPGYMITSCDLFNSAQPVSTENSGHYTSFGTSQAAAHVTAVLALLQQNNPTAGPWELIDVLRESSIPVGDPKLPSAVYNGVDAWAALHYGNPARLWTIY